MFNDKQPEYWKEIAKHDIDTAELLIKEQGHKDIIIYHLHQGIEKLIKGLILKNKANFPYIHDLERLYKILSEKIDNLGEIEEDIILLQSFYQELRYPQSEFLGADELYEAKKSFDLIYLTVIEYFDK